MLGREFDAPRAMEVGIVQEVVSPEALPKAIGAWVAPNRAVASAHKEMIDRLEARHDRPETLWSDLDGLRARSVAGSDRQAALDRFADRSSSSSASA